MPLRQEPENNLEFGNAIELAAQFSSFSQNVAQILLTTHSPVFYDLKNTENRNVVCYHVYRENDERGTTVTTQINDLDDRMGTVAILAPRVQDLIRNVREQAEASLRAQELAKQNRPKIFVEGESDKIVLERCVKAFYPDCSSLVDFETKESGGGHEFVIDMLRGWRAHHKHHPQRPRAAGILDLDANEQRKAWNRTEGVISSAKCFCYPKPPHIIPILQAHYRLQITLEHLYDEEIWEWADSQGMLESRTPRELLEIYPEERLVALVQGDDFSPRISGRKEIFVRKKFRLGTKVDVARHVSRFKDEDVHARMCFMKPFLFEVLSYLGVLGGNHEKNTPPDDTEAEAAELRTAVTQEA